ncbi:MAG: M24 family metallopeptidase [Sutterellaceae bacterium]|nr:M24 family metallopeptidase [Sutterellaceae bacterium]MDD7441667.1 M24 family metallopeptidase [Sutterellaceae bacterium]MDY2868265.1 M24 family metallopeptidase [Mesosutterella sp.]
MNTKDKVSAIRDWMEREGADCVLLTTLDPHQSESVADHWKAVQWATGFTGSMGEALVCRNSAAFWTDGRYEEQARRQVDGSVFETFSISNPESPSPGSWLLEHLGEGAVLALDGSVLSVASARKLKSELSEKGIRIRPEIDGVLALWVDRPAIPGDPLYELEPEFTCRSRGEKLALVRSRLPERGAVAVTTLDDIVWLTNLRGHDNPLYPFFHAYALVTKDRAVLCTDLGKIPPGLKARIRSDGFELRPYGEMPRLIEELSKETILSLDPWKTPESLRLAVPEGVRVREEPALVTGIKAEKSQKEQENIRRANLHECAAVVRLMMWIEENAGSGALTEYMVGKKLEEFRRLDPLYIQPANVPIVGYGPNAALPHYRPTKDVSSPVKPEGFLLFDVCAQWRCGSTDLTRTVAVGPLTDEMRRDYTTVLKANIRLAEQKFPEGTTGNLLDAIVKAPYWNKLENFSHGTGHGIGYISNIHEGPAKIITEYAPAFPYALRTPLRPGMLFSDEPGLYKPGRHGIRIENSILVKEAGKSEFGRFLGFETVTFLPFEGKAIVPEMLTEAEKSWIRGYYERMKEGLRPLLSESEFAWLCRKAVI